MRYVSVLINIVQMNDDSNDFAGVAFHCYAGSVAQQDAFHAAYPKKDIFFTECSGTYGSDWWSDIKVRWVNVSYTTVC